jgi:hypothetical protein
LDKEAGELLPIGIEKKSPEDGDKDCERNTLHGHEHVIGNYVHDDRAQNRERERHITIDEQKQAAHELYRTNYENILRLNQRIEECPAGVGGRGGIGRKCKKGLEPKKTKIRSKRIRAIIMAIFMRFPFAMRIFCGSRMLPEFE